LVLIKLLKSFQLSIPTEIVLKNQNENRVEITRVRNANGALKDAFTDFNFFNQKIYEIQLLEIENGFPLLKIKKLIFSGVKESCFTF